jgi:hypothetical protein
VKAFLIFVLTALVALLHGQGSAQKNLSITVTSSGGSATPILCPNPGQTGNNANCVQSPVLTFGKQGTSTASMPLTVTVSNCGLVAVPGTTSVPQVAGCTGSGSLTLGSAYETITTGNSTDFAVSTSGLANPCSNNLVIPSGSYCQLNITFTPSASSGTNESTLLTISDNGTTSTQTMSITGTSATVTSLSACGALSSSTNYQLTTNLSASGSCLTEAGSNIDVNLDGFTITYCTSSSSSIVAGVGMTGNSTSLTVHNGTIVDSTGACTGTVSSGYSSSDVGATSGSGTTKGTTVFNMNLTQKAKTGKIVFEENQSDSTATPVTTVHDVIFTDLDPGNCSIVGCRAESQFYSIYSDQGFHRPATGGSDQFYNIIGTAGPQGAISDTAPMNCSNNLMNPGQTGANATVANGFVCQDWGPNSTVASNLLVGTGVSGSTVSTRGIQVSSANNNVVTGTVVQGNTGIVRILDNDAEYACGSFEYGSTYGIQINTAGSGYDLSNNQFIGNTVMVLAGPCGAYAFSDSSATLASGVNISQGNNWICRGTAGWTQTANVNCAGMRFDANQYGPGQCGPGGTGQCGYGLEAFNSKQDYFSGDSADIYIWYDGNAPWECSQCIFNKPASAIASWTFMNNNNGGGSGGSSGPFYLVDPAFSGGATEAANNLSTWAGNNGSFSFSYYIQFTQTVTVKGAVSGNPISGATVTYTDALSNNYIGTTNGSGVATVVVSENQYGAAGGSYTVTHFNNYSYTVTASGCSSGGASGLNITTPNAVNVSLGGC